MSYIHCFAYGSNMDAKQMSNRCPDSALVSTAMLEGWRFRINKRGVATVVPQENSTVYGIVWLLSKADEESLDDYEGVNAGIYTKAIIDVCRNNGGHLNALVYLANDDQPGHPRPRYLETIVAAAITHGMPLAYLDELRTWSTIRD